MHQILRQRVRLGRFELLQLIDPTTGSSEATRRKTCSGDGVVAVAYRADLASRSAADDLNAREQMLYF